MNKISFTSSLTVLLVLFSISTISVATNTQHWKKNNESNTKTIDHQLWQVVLDNYLITNHPSQVNRFRYSEVTEKDKKVINSYLIKLQNVDPRDYKKIEQMAYWINLYNTLTVQLILNNYPVKSIKKIGKGFFSFGPWDDEVAIIAGQKLSLNDIEHKILRPIWQDPRIHYAVNCASYGCPNLASKAYTATNINILLDLAAHDYINHTRGVSTNDGKLVVSSIYHWYREDFGGKDSMLIEHLMHYAEPGLKQYLSQYQGVIDHKYDWRLNEPNKKY